MASNRQKLRRSNNNSKRGQKRGLGSRRNIGQYRNRNPPDNKVSQLYLNNLHESDVGVSEYISKTEGLSATINSRYSDFHVNEIDLEGNVIKIKQLTVPYDLKIEDTEQKEADAKLNAELEAKLTTENGVSSEQMEAIKNLAEVGEVQATFKMDVSKLSKEQRIAISKIIQEMFKGVISTTTQSKGDDHFLTYTKIKAKQKYESSKKWLWPGEFTYFVLYKENIATMKAVTLLASTLRCPESMIVYAGTKDKGAKTTQLCCMHKRNPNEILNAAKRFPMLKVGNFDFKPNTLKLGNLKGNQFRLALRNVTASDDTISNALNSLKINGFINYFDLLRFGNQSKIRTFGIGKALIKGDWKMACDIIMKPREYEIESIKKVKTKWWENRDAVAALGMLSRRSQIMEAKILKGFVLFGNDDYFAALDGLSRNMRLLYIHSYQSLVWNKIVSRRIKEWGNELREGDLVVVDKTKPNLYRYANNIVVQEANESELIDEEELGESKEVEENHENDIEEIPNYKNLAKPLTKADISSKKYTIHNLVLPLPGYDILYPNNDTKKWYEELLSEDGLTFESFKAADKLYSLPGEYRLVVVKPESFKWRSVNYKSPIETLILSDFEELCGKTLEELNEPKPPKNDPAKPTESTEKTAKVIEKSVEVKAASDEPIQSGKAIILEFDLPSSCYSTMLLREILKIDTSDANQVKPNNQLDGTKRKLSTSAEDAKKLKSE